MLLFEMQMRSDKLQNINEELNVSTKQLKRQLTTMEEEMHTLKQEKVAHLEIIHIIL